MKEDLHIHTIYSHHALNTAEDCVRAAICKGIDVIAITDHAPFVNDHANRLSIDELSIYLDEILFLKQKYKEYIRILSGLEIDYTPDTIDFTAKLLENVQVDFSIGSVHFIQNENEIIKIWEIEKLNNEKIISRYFDYIWGAIDCGLFDVIGHMDNILRGGMSMDIYNDYCGRLITVLKKHQTTIEINTSILRKNFYDIKNNHSVAPPSVFPDEDIIQMLANNDITFTIGSDSHSIMDIGKDNDIAVQLVNRVKGTLVYFNHHKKHLVG